MNNQRKLRQIWLVAGVLLLVTALSVLVIMTYMHREIILDQSGFLQNSDFICATNTAVQQTINATETAKAQ
jgi:hypothetical protein